MSKSKSHSVSESLTRSPIELPWTAKNILTFLCLTLFRSELARNRDHHREPRRPDRHSLRGDSREQDCFRKSPHSWSLEPVPSLRMKTKLKETYITNTYQEKWTVFEDETSLDFNWDNNSSGISNLALYIFGYLKTILAQVSSLSRSSSCFPFWQLLLVNKFSRALSSHCLLSRNLLKTCPLVESSQ